jgi:hypothetical protein
MSVTGFIELTRRIPYQQDIDGFNNLKEKINKSYYEIGSCCWLRKNGRTGHD